MLNFDHYRDGWNVHFLQADCRTGVGSRTRYLKFTTLDKPPQLRHAVSA
jgi:hypothetical protein